jgi:hypothetical protein
LIPISTSIGNSAFSGCTSLGTASFLTATSIGESAFSGCTSLSSALFPEATSIGNSAFSGCSNLRETHFPRVTSIGSSAFYNCPLTVISLPKATSIGANAFYECPLVDVTFPDTITSVGSSAFPSTDITTLRLVGEDEMGQRIESACQKLKSGGFRDTVRNFFFTLGDGPSNLSNGTIGEQRLFTYIYNVLGVTREQFGMFYYSSSSSGSGTLTLGPRFANCWLRPRELNESNQNPFGQNNTNPAINTITGSTNSTAELIFFPKMIRDIVDDYSSPIGTFSYF